MAQNEPPWAWIARELRAMAQTGLTFTQDRFDRQRYERLQELTSILLTQGMPQDGGQTQSAILDILKQGAGYATPKVDVRGAAFRDGRVLLVREISDGNWTLPGGWADVNQTPAECVVREIAEESGFEARARKLAAVYDFQRSNRVGHLDSIYKLFFICEITGGAPRPSEETSEVAFFPPDALPPLSQGRTTATQIHRMFEHQRQPGLATDFE